MNRQTHSIRQLLSLVVCILVLTCLFSAAALAEGELDELETLEIEIPQPAPEFPSLWVRTADAGGNPVGGFALNLVLPSGDVAGAVVTDDNGLAFWDLAETGNSTDASIADAADSTYYHLDSSIPVALDWGSLVSVGNQADTGFSAASPYVITVVPNSHQVSVADGMEGGTVSVSVATAALGETVNITATPYENFALTSLRVLQGETDVEVTGSGSAFSFVMPAGDVIVSAAFQAIPQPTFETHSLVLGGELGLNFFMNLPAADGVDYSDSYMDFAVNGKNLQDPFDPADTDLGENGYYGFTCPLNVMQMADEITAVFHYNANSVAKTVSQTYSAETYLNALIGSDTVSDGVKTLARSLVDYGYYSQVFLSGLEGRTPETDHTRMATPFTVYSDEQIAAIREAIADQEFTRGRNRNIQAVTCSLYLDSTTSLFLYVKPADDYSGGISATVDGAAAAVTPEGGRYRIVIPAILADQLGEVHQVSIATDGADPMNVQVSALAYIRTCLAYEGASAEMVNAMAALYSYYQASSALKQGY